MDPDSPTQKLIERTRLRREMLNQRIAVLPEAAPRKRRTPVYDSEGKEPVLSEQKSNEDDSPKRQCLRGREQQIKPDTPAIRGIASRVQDLTDSIETTEDQENQEEDVPVPTPRKSLTSPPLGRKTLAQDKPPSSQTVSRTPVSSRKDRLAALAQTINDWEDDLSHHSLQKEPEKKPAWQSPVKKDFGVKVTESGKGPAPRVPSSPVKTAVNSPKKTHAPPTPRSPANAFSRDSPLRGSKVEVNRSPRPFVPLHKAGSPSFRRVNPVKSSSDAAMETDNKVKLPPVITKSATAILSTIPADIPVNAPGLLESPPTASDEKEMTNAQAVMPMSNHLLSSIKTSQTPKGRMSLEPSKQPMSAKLAKFEQKISENTPKFGLSNSARATRSQKQVCTPALSASTPVMSTRSKDCDPSELPISQRMSQMQEKLLKTTPSRKKQDEPTEYPVGARMSAWENMSSSNMVSNIKKVNPGEATPVNNRPPVSKTPVKSQAATPKPPPAPKGTPKITPNKSFKDSIAQRASHILKGKQNIGDEHMEKESGVTNNSPAKSVSVGNLKGKSPGKIAYSPSKVSSGTKITQDKLLKRTLDSNTNCSAMAAESRQSRLAELDAVKNRWRDGSSQSDESSSECAGKPTTVVGKKTPVNEKRERGRNKARTEFNNKLAEIGLVEETNSPAPVRPPPPTNQKSVRTPSQTSSIYNLIKKRDGQVAGNTGKPSPQKVTFNDSFDDSDDESMSKIPRSVSRKAKNVAHSEPEETVAFKKPPTPKKYIEDETEQGSTSEMTDVSTSARSSLEIDDDDISLKGFVSEAVRRESILPLRRPTSHSSLDSYDDEQNPSGSDGGATSAGGGYRPDDESMDDDETTDRDAMDDLLDEAMDTTADNYDPAMDPNNVVLRKKKTSFRAPKEEKYDPDMDINNVVLRRKPQQSSTGRATRSRPSYMNAVESTDDDDSDRPYSLHAYRKSVNVVQHQMEPVVRNSKYHGRNVVEEEVAMPSSPRPTRDERKAVQERIKELQELVHQEQNIIMQTSNALNKCCLGNAYFAGSSEQVECNRILLIACKKREVYMTEIQRMKESGKLPNNDFGQQGSLTISDIRLPLKKEFVTKIGTSHDNMTHFFILLIRNGCQLICTQMLSTHDSMMRGSLDFPNLIKINGITSNFKLSLDIYTMSIMRELSVKDKKRKTPKKSKGGAFPVESPGGPSAVRTTSFSHVTSLHLTMRSLDKTSFHLDRLSHLSPLYGQIFLRVKCLMESNVEERGFLTMFDDVSGFGAWHRRWCVLSGSRLCVWKYPDDETRKDPMALVDLKRCVTEKVGLIPRDICARPNTFEMVTVRQPLKGEHDTLVTRTHNTMTTVRHQISADTKEERIVWCNKINRTLANLRSWSADALRPAK